MAALQSSVQEEVTKKILTSAWRSFGRRLLSNVTLRSLRQYPVEPIVNEIASLVKIRGLEVDSNDIDGLVEEHNQELMELHCVSQQEVMEESLPEEEVTEQQQSSNAIKEMLKAWETVASYIEKHQPNKESKHATYASYKYIKI
ncbi:hypothetical protein AVEN_217304-1 [Araneus ventricosus]|uniref:Uncharacterized protein n=1 Tax=Araneus ventricosus TaxID=182803 RepID=A0A4Y2SZS4_ARAVE|nr:hypothetical protein AVEN_217304-1 [Araneus ventricosus]